MARSRFRLPFASPRQLRRDIDDELAFHLSVSAEEHERRGLAPADARVRAEARLGDMHGLRQALYRIDYRLTREDRLMNWLNELRHDFRFSLRRMRRRPLLFLLILTTLAIGTATVTTFFGAADAILLRPLPIAEQERVMTIWRAPVANPEIRTGLAAGTIADLAEESRAFSAIAAAEPWAHDFAVDGVNHSISAWRVTEGFFDIFRTRPHAGRLLEWTDYTPQSPRVVVVAHEFFRTRLGGDPSIVGQTTLLDGEPYTVAGVLPPDFPLPQGRQLFTPFVVTGDAREDRRSDYHHAFGLLARGVLPPAALAEVQELARRSDARIAGTQTPREIQLVPLADAIFGPFRTGLGLLTLGAFLLLLMTGANAAGLMVADMLDRYRELTIRASVGAGRGRIVRQLATESVVLALIAGLVGFSVGLMGLRAFQRWAPAELPRVAQLGVDFRLVAIAVAAVLILAAIVALLPARLVMRADLRESLEHSASPWAGQAGRRTRLALVGTQVALASLLLGGGGLLVRSWVALQAEDQGYEAGGVVAMDGHVWQYFTTPDARAAFGMEAVELLAARSGVEVTALASSLPLAPMIGNERARVRTPAREDEVNVRAVVGTPRIFDLLRIPLIQGRGFDSDDHRNGEPVVIISRAAASLLFPGEDPIGQMVDISYSAPPQPRRVVGVVGDVRHASPVEPGEPALYMPHAQVPTGSVYLAARYGVPNAAAAGAAAISSVALELVPEASIGTTTDLERLYQEATAPRRFGMLLLTAFSGVALALTALGLFGLLAQNVRVRRHELGIRMAIGAWPGSLRNMVLSEAIRLTGKGLTVGILALLFLSGVLSRVLYGVPPHDPVTIAGVVVIILAVAALASWWPAVQATRVDPARVLRP